MTPSDAAQNLAHDAEQQRQRILSLSAGRDLNALVAEHVFGWERIDRDGLPPYWLTDERHADRSRVPANSYSIPPYSTDPGAAMLVLDAWEGDWNIRRQNGHFEVYLYQPSMQGSDWADTLPLAICRMRLRAALAWTR